MTYAGHRRIIDVDSHLIELDDFLHNAASEQDKPLLHPMAEQTVLPVVEENMNRGRELFAKRQNNPDTMAKFEAAILDNTKSGWSRLGAFDPAERSHAVDLFGYELQLVLPTFSFHQVVHLDDPAELEAGCRTLNKALAEFCQKDERLHPVGYLPLSLGPEKSLELFHAGRDAGCYSYIVPTNQPDDEAISYTHPDYDPVWAAFAEAGIPFACHVAGNGDYQPVSPSFKNNGRSEVVLGGDAPAGELGLMTIGNSQQLFFAAMIFDGVFDRHPDLVGISMEHGAFWLPGWLKSLDFIENMTKRRREYQRSPSEVARQQIKVSPFAGEPVGWIMENVGREMLVYASDYPHPEGSGNPISKFEASMPNCSEEDMHAFYYGNMAQVMGLPA